MGIGYLSAAMQNFISPVLWPHNSSELNSTDYKI